MTQMTALAALRRLGAAGGILYGVICAWSGTTIPSLNLWFVSEYLRNYFEGLFSRDRSEGLLGFWRAAVLRGVTLRRVLRLEIDHQRNIRAAGGPAAVAEDPTRLWRLGLLHVASARQAARAAKKAAAAMSAETGPVLKDVVLVGGGHSHAHILLMMGMEPIPNVRVTLITRDMETPYSGMLPGHIAGHYTKQECHIDLARLGRFARCRVVHAEVIGIDTVSQRVHVRSCLDDEGGRERPSLRYDVISVDVGCSPSTVGGLSGYDLQSSGGALGQHVATVKPIDGFSAKFERLVAGIAGWQEPHDILVVGAGAGGVELVLAIQHRLWTTLERMGKPRDWARLAIVSRSARIMPGHSRSVSNLMRKVVDERGIVVHTALAAQKVVKASDGKKEMLVCVTPFPANDECRLPFDECIWCTDGAPQAWMRDLDLEKDAGGFLLVETSLQARKKGGDVLPNFFAAGDCCSIRDHPRPKAGVFAVMAGMPLSKNIRAALEGRPMVEYLPQKEFLGIIGLGSRSAVASKADVALQADWLWDLKEWIDRAWMWKYTEGLPRMSSSASGPSDVAKVAGSEALQLLAKASMRCGGCGSKVGSSVLTGAIQRLQVEQPVHRNPEVLLGLDAPDDAAVVKQKGSTGVTVHTVDFFKSIVGDPYVFGRIAALHALSDCFAMGAQAQTALALCTISLGSDEVMSEDLFQIMAGANRELVAAGCTLAGGHTTEGPEPGFGLCVTGVADDLDMLMKKGGLKPGDALILTKPLGTGCLFAGEMQQRARGQHVSAALRSMLRSNEPAAQIARLQGSRTCTDVTGFGLAGHLLEMCKASEGIAVSLWLDQVPVLDGAEALVTEGIMSSLQPANFRSRRGIANEEAVAAAFAAGSLPRYPLLFDPQTNGGLLFAVSGGQQAASALVAALAKAGEDSWHIGVVSARPSSWEDGRFLTIKASALSA
ncbi:unnamed protein product [Polarella glacialis]|uniref:Selenide, water dikinase n=1 Tax=Polarella glacialis TaxID=89957 RepID=A0A813G1F3_POLGL|nr:unnamed protein product [Polarella glacialis]